VFLVLSPYPKNVIELLHVVWAEKAGWPTPDMHSHIANKDSVGYKFRLLISISDGALWVTILEVVQWWENYVGPADMLQSIEIIPKESK
jgi:hypothetical protein